MYNEYQEDMQAIKKNESLTYHILLTKKTSQVSVLYIIVIYILGSVEFIYKGGKWYKSLELEA